MCTGASALLCRYKAPSDDELNVLARSLSEFARLRAGVISGLLGLVQMTRYLNVTVELLLLLNDKILFQKLLYSSLKILRSFGPSPRYLRLNHNFFFIFNHLVLYQIVKTRFLFGVFLLTDSI